MDYTVVHSGRRTIAIQIQRDGRVVVRAPYAATAEDIRRVVDSHRDWVEKTVRRQQEQLAASPPEPTAREMEELARQGREYLPRRVAYWAARMGVMPTGLHITAARTRWGSCSGKTASAFPCFSCAIPRRPSTPWWSMSWPISATKTTARSFTAWWRPPCPITGSASPF